MHKYLPTPEGGVTRKHVNDMTKSELYYLVRVQGLDCMHPEHRKTAQVHARTMWETK